MSISVTVRQEEQNQTIPKQSGSQLQWHVMYMDRYTCQEGQMDGQQEDVRFQITLLNPDAAGNPLDHFSAEEAGETTCGKCSVCVSQIGFRFMFNVCQNELAR